MMPVPPIAREPGTATYCSARAPEPVSPAVRNRKRLLELPVRHANLLPTGRDDTRSTVCAHLLRARVRLRPSGWLSCASSQAIYSASPRRKFSECSLSFMHILDLGARVFAVSGAVAAVNRRLDIFGILAFVTGSLGGITRDLLIGAVPPAAQTDGRYLLFPFWRGSSLFVGMPASTGCALPFSFLMRLDCHSSPSSARKRRWCSS